MKKSRYGQPEERSACVLVLIISTLGAAGCAARPHVGSNPDPKAIASYASEQSLAAPAAEWPADGWWRAYADPQLTRLIDTALLGTPTLAQARARALKAQAAVSEQRSTTLPTLDGSGNIGKTKESLNQGFPPQFAQYLPRGYNSTGELELKFGYEFDFWGKNRAAIAAAVSEACAAQADAAEARLALSTGIALAYADLGRLYAEYDVAVRAVQIREETARLVSQRVEEGLDTRAELKQADAGPPTARAQMAALDEEIAIRRDQIAALLGVGPDQALSLTRPTVAQLKSFGLPTQLAAGLLGRRPDIVAAKWRAEAAAKRVGAARAQFYPNINLLAYIGQQAVYTSLLFKSSSQIGGVGPAVTLPIFEGGRLRAQYRQAYADYDDAVATYDGTVIQALQQVSDVAVSERSLTTRLKESRSAQEADEEAYRLLKLRYEGGLSNYQSVLLAEDAVLQAQQTVADLEVRAFTLDVELVQALGGGYAQS
jgi:NodT family efflux transporter outer membrane factor (OMF) lipoprotein